MSSMTFGQKSFTPIPPEKGSFPLDHEGVCKKLMLKYMICLRETKNNNSECRKQIKDYLACRMENNLMAKEEWSKLVKMEKDISEIGFFSEPGNISRQDSCLKKPIMMGSLTASSNTKKTLLVCSTGSVATIKLPEIIAEFQDNTDKVIIDVVLTEKAKHFFSITQGTMQTTNIYTDSEWNIERLPFLPEELAQRASTLLVAPLDANTLAKIANGLCDNLLTNIVRTWDFKKVAFCCPAMNTQMWNHPITEIHIKELEFLGFTIIPPITKKLACGDYGVGAMAEPKDIVSIVKNFV